MVQNAYEFLERVINGRHEHPNKNCSKCCPKNNYIAVTYINQNSNVSPNPDPEPKKVRIPNPKPQPEPEPQPNEDQSKNNEGADNEINQNNRSKVTVNNYIVIDLKNNASINHSNINIHPTLNGTSTFD